MYNNCNITTEPHAGLSKPRPFPRYEDALTAPSRSTLDQNLLWFWILEGQRVLPFVVGKKIPSRLLTEGNNLFIAIIPTWAITKELINQILNHLQFISYTLHSNTNAKKFKKRSFQMMNKMRVSLLRVPCFTYLGVSFVLRGQACKFEF